MMIELTKRRICSLSVQNIVVFIQMHWKWNIFGFIHPSIRIHVINHFVLYISLVLCYFEKKKPKQQNSNSKISLFSVCGLATSVCMEHEILASFVHEAKRCWLKFQNSPPIFHFSGVLLLPLFWGCVDGRMWMRFGNICRAFRHWIYACVCCVYVIR